MLQTRSIIKPRLAYPICRGTDRFVNSLKKTKVERNNLGIDMIGLYTNFLYSLHT